MSRYIDADELLTRLPEDLPYKASVKSVLMQAPTADVGEVVRCENCKYFGRKISAEYHNCQRYVLPYCGENDFCSYGERRATYDKRQ